MAPKSIRRRSLSDPLERALRPPANETPEQRELRERREFEAKKVSDDIDEQLRQEKAALRKKKQEVKILLLGQSESGKSTTLKQFQLVHTPSAFHQERFAWRSVIYLNLIRSIRRILEALSPPLGESNIHHPNDPSASIRHYDDIYGNSDLESFVNISRRPSHDKLSDRSAWRFERYMKRLAPLMDLEQRLIRQLSNPDDDDEPTRLPTAGSPPWSPIAPPTPAPSPVYSIRTSSSMSPVLPNNKELALRPTNTWKKSLSLGARITSRSTKNEHTGEIRGWWEDPDDPVHVLYACAGGDFGMVQVWKDVEVRATLTKRRVRMEESSGFYLNEIERITAMKYIPTDDDILKARLKTLGVVEHTFTIKSNDRGVDWKIYDVGGARQQRQAWAPYFEDVNAIIFLAPISAFDQVLAEDPRVNRLEDSLLLWRATVSNRLLSNVCIVLFLNKCDLLKTKLEVGVQLKHHMISYGDRPNDYESVSRYFRNKFGALHQTFTPDRERELFIHLTSVTDTPKTSIIIQNVRDIILRSNLKGSRLI